MEFLWVVNGQCIARLVSLSRVPGGSLVTDCSKADVLFWSPRHRSLTPDISSVSLSSGVFRWKYNVNSREFDITIFDKKEKNTNKNLSILSFKLILTWLAFEKFSGWTNCHGELSRIACVHVRCEVRSQSLVKVVAGCCYEKCSDRCSHLVLIAPIVLSLISPAGQRGGCGSPITDDVWRIMVTIANQCPWRPPTPPQTGHNQQPGKVRRREDWNWNWVSLTRIYLQHAQKGQKWCWFTSVYNFLHSSSIFSHKYWSNLQHFPIPVQCSIVSLLESRSALGLFARDNIIVCCLLFSVSPSISVFYVNI